MTAKKSQPTTASAPAKPAAADLKAGKASGKREAAAAPEPSPKAAAAQSKAPAKVAGKAAEKAVEKAPVKGSEKVVAKAPEKAAEKVSEKKAPAKTAAKPAGKEPAAAKGKGADKPAAKDSGARKGKADRLAAAVDPVDLGDDDLLDGEVGAEELLPADVTEATAKAKPLRMKVPKSKERALIREFGLDVTALTDEEAEKRRSDLKALVTMGKTRGFLTQQEINDHLPEKLVDAEVLEALVKMLGDMGVAVGRVGLVDGRLGIRPHHRPGAHVHARDGLLRPAHA
jgi:RNA polymerase primary sigma factor